MNDWRNASQEPAWWKDSDKFRTNAPSLSLRTCSGSQRLEVLLLGRVALVGEGLFGLGDTEPGVALAKETRRLRLVGETDSLPRGLGALERELRRVGTDKGVFMAARGATDERLGATEDRLLTGLEGE